MLLDNLGRIVLSKKVQTAKQFINIDHLPSGLYQYFIAPNEIKKQKINGKLIITQ